MCKTGPPPSSAPSATTGAPWDGSADRTRISGKSDTIRPVAPRPFRATTVTGRLDAMNTVMSPALSTQHGILERVPGQQLGPDAARVGGSMQHAGDVAQPDRASSRITLDSLGRIHLNRAPGTFSGNRAIGLLLPGSARRLCAQIPCLKRDRYGYCRPQPRHARRPSPGARRFRPPAVSSQDSPPAFWTRITPPPEKHRTAPPTLPT